MSALQDRPKKKRLSFEAEARRGKAMYAFAIEPRNLKRMRWDKIAGAGLMIVRIGKDPRTDSLEALGKSLGRVQFVRPGARTRTAKPAAPTIREEAFQLGAKARALLRGVEIVQRDLEASGGAFGLEDVCKLMHGVTRQAIHKRVNEGSLLAVPGPSNRNVYPVAQFTADGMPVEGLKEVREALATKSPWMLLNFLVNSESRLGNKKPIDLLKAGELETVIETARRTGVQGA